MSATKRFWKWLTFPCAWNGHDYKTLSRRECDRGTGNYLGGQEITTKYWEFKVECRGCGTRDFKFNDFEYAYLMEEDL